MVSDCAGDVTANAANPAPAIAQNSFVFKLILGSPWQLALNEAISATALVVDP
jgi:hypothetical protein